MSEPTPIELDSILRDICHDGASLPPAAAQEIDSGYEYGMRRLIGDLFPGASYLVVGQDRLSHLLNIAWYEVIHRKVASAFLCLESQPQEIVRSLLAMTTRAPAACGHADEEPPNHAIEVAIAAAKLRAAPLAIYRASGVGIDAFLRLLKKLSKDGETEIYSLIRSRAFASETGE